jgi:hypothetical protein
VSIASPPYLPSQAVVAGSENISGDNEMFSDPFVFAGMRAIAASLRERGRGGGNHRREAWGR